MSAQALTDAFLRRLMLLRPVYPDIEKPRSGPRVYVNPDYAAEEAVAVYEDERAYPFESYFGHALELHGKTVFDLGCYCGGRAVAWAKYYGLRHVAGIDIHPAMAEAGNRFAAAQGVSSEFKTGYGENIPFGSSEFDAILTFDVLEHVRDLGKVLAECYRILKPGGRMYLVFPQYLHPLEHHLSNVTLTPCIHYFFCGEKLIRVYTKLLRERGDAAAWYTRQSSGLAPWEKCHTINGTSIANFDGLVERSGFETVERIDPPLFTAGRNLSRSKSVAIRVAKTASRVGARLPFFREICTHRIVRVLEKPA